MCTLCRLNNYVACAMVWLSASIFAPSRTSLPYGSPAGRIPDGLWDGPACERLVGGSDLADSCPPRGFVIDSEGLHFDPARSVGEITPSFFEAPLSLLLSSVGALWAVL